MKGSLLFNARQDYETTTNNNRSRDAGGVNIDSVNTTIDFINDRVSYENC